MPETLYTQGFKAGRDYAIAKALQVMNGAAYRETLRDEGIHYPGMALVVLNNMLEAIARDMPVVMPTAPDKPKPNP